jgi:HECT-domain (ubiquitin-transferase)
VRLSFYEFFPYYVGMDLEDKRRLLQFTTGSDRIPVGGLARYSTGIYKFIVPRQNVWINSDD